ncbi:MULTISPECIES: Wadjet anti-phage system protein JetD domain-containing protein [unclassified Microcoleus]|uniref:Wadjet anti-phage system protein JetD domain-containing protein n=1 Tax=unclassified Microcoleus TaxID=2642155 RepID=UPI002FD2BA71
MITPEEIRKKAERLYIPFLQSLLLGEPFFPRDFAAGRTIPDDFQKLRDAVEQLKKGSKHCVGYGYQLESIRRKTRFDMQSLPSRIIFEAETDYLKFLNKESEVADFKQAVARMRNEFPELKIWLSQNPKKVIKHLGKWDNLLRVCLYFQKNPKPHLYIRELPINVHTKFIEQNQGILNELLSAILPDDAINPEGNDFEKRFGLRYAEPSVTIRALDQNLQVKHGISTSEMSILISDFERRKLQGYRFIITENLMNFRNLPDLSNSFALWGKGFNVAILKDVEWLNDCQIIYWGDLDAQGFQILSQLRSYFSEINSVMMDRETFDTFQEYAVPGTLCKVANLPYLKPKEHDLFVYLSKQTIRLEQEKIPKDFVIGRLINLVDR